MVNCNPETVSTDYDTSDRLYFEPLDEEAVLAVLEREQPVGVCIQFGGQTPLKLARAIERAGFRILGTPFDAVDLAEDRERFGQLAESIGVRCPAWGIVSTPAEATAIAAEIGYPVLVRPSYVLGGRAMRVCWDDAEVSEAMTAVDGAAVLVDRFLENAIELDVDALCDGRETYVAAVMEHVEEAGIHSGDSSCVLPAPSDDGRAREIVRRLGPALGVVGLLNVQLAIVAGEIYVLEVNPRASRTVPFASKAIGVNLVDAACRLAAGAALADLDLPEEPSGTMPESHVKAAVLPFARFPGADPVLGPEMRSTGEVMASAADFPTAFAKAERAAGRTLPTGGRAFITVRDADKAAVLPIAQALGELGFEVVATGGTARALAAAGIAVSAVEKGAAVVELLRRRDIDLVVNTPEGRNARRDGYAIREAAMIARVPCITTLAGARAAVEALAKAQYEEAISLQERHAGQRSDAAEGEALWPEATRAAS
jgi:carbamoyl-phosphate synthase large subunit